MNKTKTQYVCPLCQNSYSHHLVYCYKCPGKLVRKEIPFPNARGYFNTMKEYTAWLESHGLKDGGL